MFLLIDRNGINLQFSQASRVTGMASRPLTREGKSFSPNIRRKTNFIPIS